MANFGTLLVRRIVLVVVSLIVGILGNLFAVYVILGTVPSDYGTVYNVFTALSIALGVAVWLDHDRVLNTKILPH